MIIKRLILMFFVTTLAVEAASKRCSVCETKIRGRYLTVGEQVFCSKKCHHTILENCSQCDKKLAGKFIVSEDKKYCSKHCFETTLPECEICAEKLMHRHIINGHIFCEYHMKGPHCGSCQLPFARGGELPDKRHICEKCNETAIYDIDDGMPLFRRARFVLHKITGNKSPQIPKLRLVGRDKLEEMNNVTSITHDSMHLNGFYRRTETERNMRNGFGRVVKSSLDVKKTIYIAYALTPNTFLATAVHEFTHDMISEFYPDLQEAPLWVQEGICQYLAAIVCNESGYKDELGSIESSPDNVYGDGYRYFKRTLGAHDWPAMLKWIQAADVEKLAADVPRGE